MNLLPKTRCAPHATCVFFLAAASADAAPAEDACERSRAALERAENARTEARKDLSVAIRSHFEKPLEQLKQSEKLRRELRKSIGTEVSLRAKDEGSEQFWASLLHKVQDSATHQRIKFDKDAPHLSSSKSSCLDMINSSATALANRRLNKSDAALTDDDADDLVTQCISFLDIDLDGSMLEDVETCLIQESSGMTLNDWGAADQRTSLRDCLGSTLDGISWEPPRTALRVLFRLQQFQGADIMVKGAEQEVRQCRDDQI